MYGPYKGCSSFISSSEHGATHKNVLCNPFVAKPINQVHDMFKRDHHLHRLLLQYRSGHTRSMEWSMYSPAGMIMFHSTENYSVAWDRFQSQSMNWSEQWRLIREKQSVHPTAQNLHEWVCLTWTGEASLSTCCPCIWTSPPTVTNEAPDTIYTNLDTSFIVSRSANQLDFSMYAPIRSCTIHYKIVTSIDCQEVR